MHAVVSAGMEFLFFEWRGDTKGIRSLELVYSGSAGKATLSLDKP